MADADRDEKVSAGYRALGREEPPGTLDEAVLAAARRRPARWRVPLSVAAVLALAVGVALRMQPQGPESEPVALAPQVMQTPLPAAPAQRTTAAADAAGAAPAAATAGAAAERRQRAEVPGKPASADLTPEAWLERIAELRRQGRRQEAEQSLAEFRKRYPDHKIPAGLR